MNAKKLLLAALLCLITLPKAHSQEMHSDDLLEAYSCSSFMCLFKIAMDKGMLVADNSSDGGGDSYIFSGNYYKDAATSLEFRNLFICNVFKGSKHTFADFMTFNVKHYQNLLNEFKAKGYKYTKEEKIEGAVLLYYSSNRYNQPMRVKITNSTAKGVRVTFYNIGVY
jgi:hypothetical protein